MWEHKMNVKGKLKSKLIEKQGDNNSSNSKRRIKISLTE